MIAYAVSQRTRELGVRIALGASPRDLLFQVIRQGLILSGIGVVIGAVLALGVTRLLRGFLYGVSPYDPVTFGYAALVLTAIAILACYFPARRTLRIDPIEALRSE